MFVLRVSPPVVPLRFRCLTRKGSSAAAVMIPGADDEEYSAINDADADSSDDNNINAFANEQPTHRISEESWRLASREHSQRIREILSPGLTPPDHPLNSGFKRQRRQRERQQQQQRNQQSSSNNNTNADAFDDESISALDPKHPVYNFLIEYYGLKGMKGVRRLLKWSPGILHEATTTATTGESSQPKTSPGRILLEGANEQDFFTSLHAKGSAIYDDKSHHRGGVVYSPLAFVYGNDPNSRLRLQQDCFRGDNNNDDDRPGSFREIPATNGGPLAPFLWFRSLLQRTTEATPVLHCYGLHEWAMQYQPATTIRSKESMLSQPPSSKYQSHLKLRIDQETLNETVETNTVFCTHVDAWKFFAQEALPLNQFPKRANRSTKVKSNASTNIDRYGARGLVPEAEERPGWLLRSEQPACVHTTMDLLKIALKLGPFCDPHLFCRVLSLTVKARSLDVAASPYDTKADYGVEPICIEKPSGRNEYRQRQKELMNQASPIRKDLLENYENFLSALSSISRQPRAKGYEQKR